MCIPKRASMILVIFLLGAFTSLLIAQDTAILLKTVDKELRQAERDMFSGKTEKAIASLENIEKNLAIVKEKDPNNPKLKTAENKFKKLVKDLERRTGKDLGGGTLTAAETSIQTAVPPKPEAKPMPEKRVPTPPSGDVESTTVEKASTAPAAKAAAPPRESRRRHRSRRHPG